MSKKKYIVIILVAVLIFASIYMLFHCCFSFDSKEWFRQEIGNADYLIVGDKIVHTSLLGCTEVEIDIYDRKRNVHMISFKTMIKDQGKGITKDNCKVEYNQDYLKVSFFDYKGDISTVHRFYFEDFEDITTHDWNP